MSIRTVAGIGRFSSFVQSLPASTTANPINVTGGALDNRPGVPIRIELYYRYRLKSNGTWGAWSLNGDQTFSGPPGALPSSFAFPFPNGQGFYAFYSVATDQFNNREAVPSVADATIQKK